MWQPCAGGAVGTWHTRRYTELRGKCVFGMGCPRTEAVYQARNSHAQMPDQQICGGGHTDLGVDLWLCGREHRRTCSGCSTWPARISSRLPCCTSKVPSPPTHVCAAIYIRIQATYVYIYILYFVNTHTHTRMYLKPDIHSIKLCADMKVNMRVHL
jgi:hypothetical protein